MREKVLRNALLGTVVLGLVSGCSTAPPRPSGEVAVATDVDIGGMPIQEGVVPRRELASSRGNPDSYIVFGRRYYVMGSSEGYRQRGIASWYGPGFHGRKTSSGAVYNMYGVSAAHKHLPIPTYARVTHLGNGRSIVVRVDDRGPFVGDRLIDLSYGAAIKLGMMGEGTTPVEVEALPPYQHLPGFASGQMLAKADRFRDIRGPRATSFSFTQPAAASGASRAPAITFRLSAPENDRNKAVVAAPLRSTPPGITFASASQPPRGDNPPAVTLAPAGAPAAAPENPENTVASAEPTGPAERDAFSFSTQLAKVERQTAATASQPPATTAPTVVLTSINPPRFPVTQPQAALTPPTRPTLATITPPVAKPTAVSTATSPPAAATKPPTGSTLAAVIPPAGANNRTLTPLVSSSSPSPLSRPPEPVAKALPAESVAAADIPVRPTAVSRKPQPAPEPSADRAKAERLAAANPEPRTAKTAGKTATADKVAARTRAVATVTPEKPTATGKSTATVTPAKPKATDKAAANERIAAATTAKPDAKADKGQSGNRTVAAADNSHLYLQVGAFTQRGNAEDLRNRLAKALRYGVRINPGKNNLHTVRVGPLNDPVEASRLKGRLAGLGISTPHVVFE